MGFCTISTSHCRSGREELVSKRTSHHLGSESGYCRASQFPLLPGSFSNPEAGTRNSEPWKERHPPAPGGCRLTAAIPNVPVYSFIYLFILSLFTCKVSRTLFRFGGSILHVFPKITCVVLLVSLLLPSKHKIHFGLFRDSSSESNSQTYNIG